MIKAVFIGFVVLYCRVHAFEFPPLFQCDGSIYTTNQIQPFCGSVCQMGWDLTTQQNIAVFNRIRYIDLKMGVCKARREEWLYSESCLWTKSDTLINAYDIKPDIDICKEMWEKNCLGDNCHIVSSPPTPSYSFCTDTKVSHDKYSITSYHSPSTAYDTIKSFIILDNFRAELVEGFHYDVVNMRYHIWDHTVKAPNDCAGKDHAVFRAYKNDSDGSFWIPDIGQILHSPFLKFDDINCRQSLTVANPIQISREGILFQETSEVPQKSSHLVALSSSLSANEKLIVNNFNNIEMMRDRRTCLSRCLRARSSGLHVIGIGALNTQGNSSQICPKLVSCLLTEKPMICNQPFAIKLNCLQHQFWWKPTEAYVEADFLCKELMMKPPKRDIKVGAVVLNTSGLYLDHHMNLDILHPETFSRSHIGNYLYQPHQVLVRKELGYSKTSSVDTINPSSYSYDHEGWTVSMKEAYNTSLSWLSKLSSSIGDEVRFIIILIVTMISIGWAVKYLSSRNRVAQPPVIIRDYTRTSPELSQVSFQKVPSSYV
ncbi:TPA_asm: G [Passiflora betacytorhabdovirus 1]|nr:TPA_asm: G [Passiflora betacytorhabdovirus 1]